MSYIQHIISARVIVGRTDASSLPSPSFPIYPPLIAKLEEARSEDRERRQKLWSLPSLPPDRERVRESPSYIRSSPGNFSIFPPNLQGLRSKKASFPVRRRSRLLLMCVLPAFLFPLEERAGAREVVRLFFASLPDRNLSCGGNFLLFLRPILEIYLQQFVARFYLWTRSFVCKGGE